MNSKIQTGHDVLLRDTRQLEIYLFSFKVQKSEQNKDGYVFPLTTHGRLQDSSFTGILQVESLLH